MININIINIIKFNRNDNIYINLNYIEFDYLIFNYS